MKAVTYIKEALNPGGTPKRYLVWVSVVLIAQALASIVPSEMFYQRFNLSHILLIGVILIGVGVNFLRNEKARILAAYFLYIVGLALCTVTISMGITSLSGIIFMLTWAMTLFVAERREYISFDLVTLFMILMLLSTVVLLLFNPTLHVAENVIILGTGAVLTGINIYLVYTDFGHEKNFYQESRKVYANLEILSAKLSEILSRKDQLENLLWHVTQECVPFLDLEECVIYLYNKEKDRLVQVAAFGGKSSEFLEILDPIEIKPGEGIVGSCFVSGKKILIEETGNHPEYIVDDESRDSELAVPIFSKGEVIGVIDSEHHKKGFFKERHSQAFHIIASFCGIKITEYYAQESIKQAELAQEEAIRFKELDELKNKFITNISHDLKTPLSLIKAPAMQIAKITSDEQVRNHSNYILKNTEHLLRVVNQLLQLNRVDKGLNELYMEDVFIDKLLSKIATQYQGLAIKDSIEFTTDVDSFKIRTDAFRLEQIIHNLVHNAFRYTGKGGKVELTVRQSGELLVIMVSDNGSGIPVENQKKIFERFYKVDVNNHEGTGIGLSLVKEYATSLKGEVEIKSAPDSGTIFTVTIPLEFEAESQSGNEPWDEGAILSNDKPVMLVVEDHADLNAFICSFFETNYQCISAFDGENALEQIERQMPDIIISDLMMPKMDGATFLQRIRTNEELSHIPVIVLSAKGQIESKVQLYDLGADNYLIKPFDIEELSAVVSSTLEQRRKLREVFYKKYLSGADVPTLEKNFNVSGDIVNKTVNAVLESLDDSSLNVSMLEEKLGIGRNKLQKEIKAETGLTPVEFMRSIRLSEARKMLTDGTRHVSEVAYAVGFNNLSYFSRAFKNEFGVLPTEWQIGVTSQ